MQLNSDSQILPPASKPRQFTETNLSTSERIIVQGDPDLEDLIPGFLNNRQEDVRIIAEALQGGDMDRIRIIGHSMKGAGGGYGFDAITDFGAEIEQAAIANDADGISAATDKLVDYLQRVDVVYE